MKVWRSEGLVLAKQKKVGRVRSGEQTNPSSLGLKFPKVPKQGAQKSSDLSYRVSVQLEVLLLPDTGGLCSQYSVLSRQNASRLHVHCSSAWRELTHGLEDTRRKKKGDLFGFLFLMLYLGILKKRGSLDFFCLIWMLKISSPFSQGDHHQRRKNQDTI